MKALWRKLTLMDYATDEDNGEIPPFEAALYGSVMAAFGWATWIILTWIVKN